MNSYLVVNPNKTCSLLQITGKEISIAEIEETYASPGQRVYRITQEHMKDVKGIDPDAWVWNASTETIEIDQNKIPPNYKQAINGINQLLPAERLGMGLDYLLLINALQFHDQALCLQVKERIVIAEYEAAEKIEAIFLAANFPDPFMGT